MWQEPVLARRLRCLSQGMRQVILSRGLQVDEPEHIKAPRVEVSAFGALATVRQAGLGPLV